MPDGGCREHFNRIKDLQAKGPGNAKVPHH